VAGATTAAPRRKVKHAKRQEVFGYQAGTSNSTSISVDSDDDDLAPPRRTREHKKSQDKWFTAVAAVKKEGRDTVDSDEDPD
jgi:hypothetical protein